MPGAWMGWGEWVDRAACSLPQVHPVLRGGRPGVVDDPHELAFRLASADRRVASIFLCILCIPTSLDLTHLAWFFAKVFISLFNECVGSPIRGHIDERRLEIILE